MITVDVEPIQRMRLRLTGLREQLLRPAGITRVLAQGVEKQTEHRVHNTKTAPDGKRWSPWSRRYARTRNAAAGHSLLKDTWEMIDGIRHGSTPHTARVTLPHPAGYHQTGTRKMPARPPLGLDAQNVTDIERWLGPVLEQMAMAAMTGARASAGEL